MSLTTFNNCLFLSLIFCLVAILGCQCGPDDFPYLIKTPDKHRIQIAYSLTRGNDKAVELQVEEFLDTESWNQLIQFKWLEERGTIPIVETILVQNGPKKRVLFRYKPFSCFMKVFDESGKVIDEETDWIEKESAPLDIMVSSVIASRRRHHGDQIESMISTHPESPYFARIPRATQEHTNEVWVVGVLGLWLRAQYRGKTNDEDLMPKLFNRSTAREEVKTKIGSTKFWRLDLHESSRAIFYYLYVSPFDINRLRQSVEANTELNQKNLIEVLDTSQSRERPKSLESIKIMELNYNFDDELAQRIISLPIGFNCKSNPLLDQAKIRHTFIGTHTYHGSHLIELEIIAIDLREKTSDTKTLTVVDSVNPLDSGVALTMVRIHEDKMRIVRDFKRRLMHTIREEGEAFHGHAMHQTCQIEHLKIATNSDERHAKNPINVQFGNGITLTIDESMLEYIFEVPQSIDRESMNYLNRIPIDDALEEHIFETKVPKSYEYMISLADGKASNTRNKDLRVVHSINIIRVYQSKQQVSSNGADNDEPLKLVRVIMIVFDRAGKNKLAELRWNLVRQLQPLSLRRRAQLFDLSDCSKLDEDSMQIIVRYPVDTEQMSQAQTRSFDLIEDFYRAYSKRRRSGDLDQHGIGPQTMTGLEINKNRVADSLNFLRLPKVELLLDGGESTNQIELRITVLDQPAPIHFFDHIDAVSFSGPTIDRLAVATAEQCARYCHQMHCRMFAYDRSDFECKLSRWSIEDRRDTAQGDNEIVVQPIGPILDMPPSVGEARAIVKQSSKLYYLPDGVVLDSGEATLSEIHSYLEHESETHQLSANPANGHHGSEGDDMEATSRVRRNPSPDRPILAFEMSTNYNDPAVYGGSRMLAPSEILMPRVPLVLDVSRESQDFSVAKAFGLKATGKRYQLNALDNWNYTPKVILMADERTFMEANRTVYFSLKRIHAIEFDRCAQLCYNIEERNFNTSSEQICRSFSYCNFEKQCVLVISTDSGFIDSSLELAEEGDIIHSIGSPDDLLRDGAGCNVRSRNNMATFNGPITLRAGIFGPSSTEALLEERPQLREQLVWMPVTSEASSPDGEDLLRERCAQACLDQSKLPHRMCLAFDFCETKTVSSEPKGGSKQHQCLLLALNSLDAINASIINDIKSKLGSSELSSMSGTFRQSPPAAPIVTCQRFLISHLLEYNNLKQRSIAPQLSVLGPSRIIHDSNIEHCAAECSLRDRPRCLLFEHCSRYDIVWKRVENNCKLFDNSAVANEQNKATSEKSDVAPQQASTVFSRDCHVYLRREFKSIDEALASLATPVANSEESRESDTGLVAKPVTQLQHGTLIIGFILVYLPISVGFVLNIRGILLVAAVVSSDEAVASAGASPDGKRSQGAEMELSDLQLSQVTMDRQKRL